MFVFHNENPRHKRREDCVVRAIATATGTDWDTAYIALAVHGLIEGDMMDHDPVWWGFLADHGFRYHAISSVCPRCVTVEEFCRAHPRGTYVIAVREHVLCAIDGDWYDIFDAADEIVLHYWTKEDENT